MNVLSIIIIFSFLLTQVIAYTFLTYNRTIKKPYDQLQEESKVLCQYFTEANGTYKIANVTEYKNKLHLFLSDDSKRKYKLQFRSTQFQKDEKRLPIHSISNSTLWLRHESARNTSSNQQLMQTIDINSTLPYYFKYKPNSRILIASQEIYLSISISKVTLDDIYFAFLIWSVVMIIMLIIFSIGILVSMDPDKGQAFYCSYIFYFVWIKMHFLTLWMPHHHGMVTFLINIVMQFTYLEFFIIPLIFAPIFYSKLKLEIKVLYCYLFVMLCYQLDEHTMLIFIICNIYTLSDQFQQQKRYGSEDYIGIYNLLIVLSFHVMKFYNEASPGLIQYSFNGLKYPKLSISYPTLLIIDLNYIISNEVVWKYLIRNCSAALKCFKNAKKTRELEESKQKEAAITEV